MAPDFGCLLETFVSQKIGARFCMTAEKHKRLFGLNLFQFFRDAVTININLVSD